MHKIAIVAMFFSFSLSAMDAPAWMMPKEVIHGIIILAHDIPTMGRFGQTCHKNQKWYRHCMICKDPHNSSCTSPLCCFIADSHHIRMKPLAFYAKEYKSYHLNNRYARDMFFHLLRHQQKERTQAVATVMGIQNPSSDDILDIYAGEYAAQEMGNLGEMKTQLSKKIGSTIIDHNTTNLKKFLIDKDIWSVKTMLLANTLWFDPGWQKCNNKTYCFAEKEKHTLLDCVCALDDIYLMNEVVTACPIPCISFAIQSMIQNYRLEMLEFFIQDNCKEAMEERFDLWKYAITDKYCDGKGLPQIPELDLQIFQKIITLLFPQEINAQDTYRKSLMSCAVEQHHHGAVEFLLQQGAHANIADGHGFFPLYNAYESPHITRLLIKSGVDVNQRTIKGRTALMSSICHGTCNEKTIQVMNILLEARADVCLVDENKQSVLHQYSQRFSGCRGDIAELIKRFIGLGVKIDWQDDQGGTAVDYAYQNGNAELLTIFGTFVEKEPVAEKTVLNILAENLTSDLPLAIPDEKDLPISSNSLSDVHQASQKRIDSVSYKNIVIINGLLLLSGAIIYYLLKNSDDIFASKNFKNLSVIKSFI